MYPQSVLISSSHGRPDQDPADPRRRHYLHTPAETQGWVVKYCGGRWASRGQALHPGLSWEGPAHTTAAGSPSSSQPPWRQWLRALEKAYSENEHLAICSRIAMDLWETHCILEQHTDDPKRVYTCWLFIRMSTPTHLKDYYKTVNTTLPELFEVEIFQQIINLDAVMRKHPTVAHLNKAGFKILRREIGKCKGHQH